MLQHMGPGDPVILGGLCFPTTISHPKGADSDTCCFKKQPKDAQTQSFPFPYPHQSTQPLVGDGFLKQLQES